MHVDAGARSFTIVSEATVGRPSERNADIEVLRAVAIVLTLFVHLDILIYWGSGQLSSVRRIFFFWGGVDLFFCISGFVITTGLLRNMNSERRFIDIALPFWIRRFWRLAPAATFWLLVVVAVSWLGNPSGYLKSPAENAMDLAFALGQLANMHFWACYAGLEHSCGINQVYWSLSLEEQCYLMLPFLILLARRAWWLRILGAIVVAQFFLGRPILSLAWFFRTDAVAWGAIIAVLSRRSSWPRLRDNPWFKGPLPLFYVVVLISCIGMLGARPELPLPTVGLMAMCCGALVWLASANQNMIARSRVMRRAALHVGSRSYSLYLVHVPVYYYARQVADFLHADPSRSNPAVILYVVGAGACVVGLAELSFRVVESPLRSYGYLLAERWAARRLVGRCVASGGELVPVRAGHRNPGDQTRN